MPSNEITIDTRVQRLTWDQWVERLHRIGRIKKVLPWVVGDLLLYGLDTFGEKAWQEIEAMGYSEGALANLKYVAKRFPPDERSAELPWSFFQACAPFDKRTREKLVTQGLSGEINRAGVRALAASKTNGASDGAEIVPDGSEGAKKGIPARVEVAEWDLAVAYVMVGKLVERRERGKLTATALDELIEKAMALKELLGDDAGS